MSSSRRIASFARLSWSIVLYASVAFTAYTLFLRPRTTYNAGPAYQKSNTIGETSPIDHAGRLWEPRSLPVNGDPHGATRPIHEARGVHGFLAQDWTLPDDYSHEQEHRSTTLLNNISFLTPSERFLLHKAFAGCLRPSEIVPFHFRRQGTFDDEDITITTLITENRFPVFARLVEKYQGPISVTLHVPPEPKSARNGLLQSLYELYTSSPAFAQRVDVHLVLTSVPRQLNAWRSVARLFARTENVMMLDVDFALCTDIRTAIAESIEMRALLRTRTAALVIPAFEYTNANSKYGQDVSKFPSDKSSLLEEVHEGRIDMFHASWAPGHNSTDYPRYYAAKPGNGEVYKVTQYQSAYEPYVIHRRDVDPWCDPRFVGYGANKAACLFEMYLAGISFYVLTDHFLIHQRHAYEEETRRLERKWNKQIYTNFKQEACLRYLSRFHHEASLAAPEAQNAVTECQKYPSIARVVVDMLEEERDARPISIFP